MSTRPLGPPAVIPDDPGPWSVVSSVFGSIGAPGRRRPQPPMGLMLSPPPTAVAGELAGLERAAGVAGAAPVRVVAAAREPAFALAFDEDGATLRGVSPHVRRSWSLPELLQASEERPGDDPAAGLAAPAAPDALAGAEPVATAPGGAYRAVYTREGRADVVAVVRAADGALVRWIRGARAAAWSADGRRLALGGPWGVILAELAEG
ncbi:hypothetical protein [Miltoncostaea marina]|uniref:hypothetical protein n=1 Tax=Miltoncostaea marina TaxID=2843215 RepID=UPI001C3E60E2|nr:hypothetical protein [Miltoncostaea marina]